MTIRKRFTDLVGGSRRSNAAEGQGYDFTAGVNAALAGASEVELQVLFSGMPGAQGEETPVKTQPSAIAPSFLPGRRPARVGWAEPEVLEPSNSNEWKR